MLKKLKSGLIVSCQAPSDSPLHEAKIIAAIARACVMRGAVGVRLDTPNHVREVRQLMPDVPIIGLWKRQYEGYEIYITPCFQDAEAIATAGADIIAIDATARKRPQGETLEGLIARIKTELGKLVMADVDSMENAIAAAGGGADLIATTLYGYTQETKHLQPPGFDLLETVAGALNVPVICEGGIKSPAQAREALDLEAHAVVVGTAITGIDLNVRAFVQQVQFETTSHC